jgi:hypothetical protein
MSTQQAFFTDANQLAKIFTPAQPLSYMNSKFFTEDGLKAVEAFQRDIRPKPNKDTVGELRRAVNFTPSTAPLNPEEPGTSRADTSVLGLKWVRQQYQQGCHQGQ